MGLSIKVVFLLISTRPLYGANILAVMSTPSPDQQIFQPLWRALLSRGHNLTLLTTEPMKIPEKSDRSGNFYQIDWSSVYQIGDDSETKHDYSISGMVNHISEITTLELQHVEVQRLISESRKFDLVFVDIANPAMLAFVHLYKCPFIALAPSEMATFVHEALGHPVSPALFSDNLVPYDSYMNFVERVMNLFYYVRSSYLKYLLDGELEVVVKENFGDETIPEFDDIRRNVSLVFYNANPILDDIRPLMTNVLMVGGLQVFESDLNLAPDLQQFLDGAKDTGVVYFNLRSSTILSEDLKTALVSTFQDLPYKVLLRFNEDNFTTKNDKILISSQVNHISILSHPNLKLWITQGSSLSIQEGVRHQVPILVVPLMADQYANARRVERKGIGLSFPYNEIITSREELKTLIEEVANNTKYKKAVLELGILLKRHPINELEDLIKWTEYVIKYKGAELLKQRSVLPTYQYFLLDIVFVVSLFLLGILYINYKILQLTIKLIKRHRKAKQTKLE